MTKEKIRERLKVCHENENELNRKISTLDITIRNCEKQKLKIAKQVSNNMLYRNKLINQL